MKNEKLLDIRKRVHTELEGLQFIKTASIGIPYAKLKLNITTRKEFQISLAHETVLKLIEEKWTNSDELRGILGVDQDYFYNILLELGSADFIIHSAKQLALTDLGRTVLRELRSIRIEPDLIENVYVNLLNGEIVNDGSSNYSRFREKVNCDVFLNAVEDLSGSYLVTHESDIKALYMDRNSKDGQSDLSDQNLSRDELYRVINIEDQVVVYFEATVNVYFSSESNSLVFVFDSGNTADDTLYHTCLRNQMKLHPKSFDRFYDSRTYYTNKSQYDGAPVIQLNELTICKSNRDELGSHLTSPNVRFEEIQDRFYCDRLLYYREYQDILSNLTEEPPLEITIVTDHFYDLQKSEYAIISLLEALDKKCRIYIGYTKGDKSSDQFISSLRKKSINNTVIKELHNIKGTTIIVDSKYLIKVSYKPVFLRGEVLFIEVSEMTINKDIILKESINFRELYNPGVEKA